MIAPKSLTPHSDLLIAEPLGRGVYRVTAARLDGRGDPLLLFRGISRAALLRYADHYGYLVEWEASW